MMHEVKEQAEEKPARPGYAPIKAEFIVDADSKDSNAKNQKSNCAVNQKSNCDEEKETNLIDSQKHQIVKINDDENIEGSTSTNFDKSILVGAESLLPKRTRARGMNKQRERKMAEAMRKIRQNSIRLCPSMLFTVDDDTDVRLNIQCKFGDNCHSEHSRERYMQCKEPDLGPDCVHYDLKGFCQFSIACRFAQAHTDISSGNFRQLRKDPETIWNPTSNIYTMHLQKRLRKHEIDFEPTNKALKLLESTDSLQHITPFADDSSITSPNTIKCANSHAQLTGAMEREKRFIDMRSLAGKKYLAPLTTVGNLPFRRICVEMGADITCSEMALATSLLQGNPSEWALIKRHPSERLFGVQIAGGYPDTLGKVTQLLTERNFDQNKHALNFDIDFIDLNLGCPIDAVVNKGGGCALAFHRSAERLNDVLRVMTTVAGDMPVSLKIRYGMKEGQHSAHHILDRLVSGQKCPLPSLVTLHPRSREQRYSKAAEWDYVSVCLEAIKGRIPLFVCGDVFSHEDYYARLSSYPDIAGIMVGRAALSKPWIFKEIDEHRHWDITSGERFDFIKKFVYYGLEHWGSDNSGVSTTRRFLLEWLSFFHRYIPVGLLEVLPQRINDKPPIYRGRDELETLMASPWASDWIRLTEMAGLGPVPDGFLFVPKHRASAY